MPGLYRLALPPHQQHCRGGRHRPHLNIIASLDDLEHRGQGRLLDRSILDPATAQRLVCDAGIHRVITDGRSSILDYGTTTRTVPANLFNALVIRDRHCRYPGCDRPPEWTEAHHLRWVTHGGPTALDNLTLQCTHHHHLLHTQVVTRSLARATMGSSSPDPSSPRS